MAPPGAKGRPGLRGRIGMIGVKGEGKFEEILLQIKKKKAKSRLFSKYSWRFSIFQMSNKFLEGTPGEDGLEGPEGDRGYSIYSFQNLENLILNFRNPGKSGEPGKMGEKGYQGIPGIDSEYCRFKFCFDLKKKKVE